MKLTTKTLKPRNLLILFQGSMRAIKLYLTSEEAAFGCLEVVF